MVRKLACALIAASSVTACQPTMAVGTTDVRHVAQHWQHYCLQVEALSDVAREGNKLGKEGWELVGFTTLGSQTVACFKRPQSGD